MSISLGSAYGSIAIDASGIKAALQVAQASFAEIEKVAAKAMQDTGGSVAQAQKIVGAMSGALGQLKASFNAATPKETIEAYNQAKLAMQTAQASIKQVSKELNAGTIDADKLKDAMERMNTAASHLGTQAGKLKGLVPSAGPTPSPPITPIVKPKLDTSALKQAASEMKQAFSSVLSGDLSGAFTSARAGVASLGEALSGIGLSGGVALAALSAVAIAIGVVVAALAIVKTSIDAFQEWTNKVRDVSEMFGMTAEEASTFATAAEMVGADVSEMAASFGYLVRSLENAKTGFDAANQQIVEAQQQASDDTKAIWADVAASRLKVQTDLARSIETIESDLGRSLTDMARSYGLQVEAFARDEIKTMNDAAKSLNDIERNRVKDLNKVDLDAAKSLAEVDSNLKESLRNTHSARDRRELKRKAAEQKAQILADAAERKAEIQQQAAERAQQIVEQRNERLAAIAEQRQLAQDQFEYQKKQAREIADIQIKEQRRAADEQIKTMEASAQKQADAIAAALTKQTDKLKDQSIADPVLRGLKQIGISAEEAFSLRGDAFEFFKRISEGISKMPEGLERSKAIFDIFGKSGTKILDMLEKGPAFFDQAYELAKSSGKLLSESDFTMSKNFTQSIQEAKIAMEGLQVQLGRNTEAMLGMKEGVKDTGDAWAGIGDTLQKAGDSLMMIAKIIMFSVWIAMDKAIAWLRKTASDIQNIWDALVTAAGVIWEIIKTTIANKVSEIQTQIVNKWNEIKTNAETAWNGIKAAIETIWNNITSIFSNVWTTFNNIGVSIADGFKAGLKPFTDAIDGIITKWNEFIAGFKLPELPGLPASGGGGGGSSGVRHGGGSIPNTGMYNLLAGEYVLNRQQTAAMAAPSADGRVYQVTIAPVFNGPVDASNSRKMIETLRDMVHVEMTRVMGAA